MRTTLIIDDHVFREAKRRAVEEGTTLSNLTTRALREALGTNSECVEGRVPFRFPTYGGTRSRDTSAGELAALRDEGR